MSQSAAQPMGAAAVETTKRQKLGFNNRYIAPVFITFILLVGHLSYGILESYEKTGDRDRQRGCGGVDPGTDLFREVVEPGERVHHRDQLRHSASFAGVWPFAVASVISIMSKYVLRVKGRHLWNPSNFGICALLFLAPETVAALSVQWGNFIWPLIVIWILGAVIIWRAKRIQHQRYLRRFVFCVCFRAQLDHRRLVVGGGRADHRTDVSTLRLLHDHRSQDER